MSNEELQQSAETKVDATVTPTMETESAPVQGETPEKVTFSEEQQRVFDDAIGRRTFKARESERKSEAEMNALKQQLAEANAKIPQQMRPDVPDLPDSFDDDFEAKQLRRDEAIKNAATFDAMQSAQEAQQQAQQQAQQAEQQQALNKDLAEYSARGLKFGISEANLHADAGVVGNYGLGNAVAEFILRNEQGPLISRYLASNPVELDNLRHLNPMDAAVRINTDIKEKAAALGVKQREAPNPAETLSGAGTPPQKRGPKGATFE